MKPYPEASPKRSPRLFFSMGILIMSSPFIVTENVYSQAQAVTCSSSSADVDGDGWGWENGASCLVNTDSGSSSSNGSGLPTCSSTSFDTDGDGYGWENSTTCIVIEEADTTALTPSLSMPNCSSASFDVDGDGWGWENGNTCIVTISDQTTPNDDSNTIPNCSSTSFDADGDGWGWENGATCTTSSSGGDNNGSTGGTDTGLEPTSSTDGVLCDYTDSTYNDSASVQTTSTSAWTCSETERVLTANGIPDHEVGTFPNAGNPNTIAEQVVSTSYTLTPTTSSSTTSLGGPAGPQGYVLNGVKIDAGTAGSCGDTGGNTCSLIDNSGAWNIEGLGQTAFDFGLDDNNAHVQPGGSYHYHGLPEGFIVKQGGNSSTMTLIAWAADGFPVYARYGYSIANDASSGIKNITGSYQLVSNPPANRPSTTTYPLGTFEQDWEYAAGTGDLDECNGRIGVTPEFPGGIYHYYATDSYPYFQRCVNGSVAGGVQTGGPGGGPARP